MKNNPEEKDLQINGNCKQTVRMRKIAEEMSMARDNPEEEAKIREIESAHSLQSQCLLLMSFMLMPKYRQFLLGFMYFGPKVDAETKFEDWESTVKSTIGEVIWLRGMQNEEQNGAEKKLPQAPFETIEELLGYFVGRMAAPENKPHARLPESHQNPDEYLARMCNDPLFHRAVDEGKLSEESKRIMDIATTCVNKGTGKYGFKINISQLAERLNCCWVTAKEKLSHAIKEIKAAAYYERVNRNVSATAEGSSYVNFHDRE